MPNFATAMRDEVKRVAKKEIKGAIKSFQELSRELQKEMQRLSKQLAALEGDASRITRRAAKDLGQAVRKDLGLKRRGRPGRKITADSIASLRKKLGLSQGDFARLLDVHKNTVLFWEKGKISPRGKAQAALQELRTAGVRAAHSRLQAMGIEVGAKGRRGRRPAKSQEGAVVAPKRRGRKPGRKPGRRGPGRPPKAEAAVVAPMKRRGPGRPPKSETASVAAPSAPKRRGRKPGRKPGRPAKVAAPMKRRGPGRPPKSEALAVTTPVAPKRPGRKPGRNPGRRGPGRPPKAQPEA